MKKEITTQEISYKDVLKLAQYKGYKQVILIGQKIWGDGAIPYLEVDNKSMLCELTLIQKWLRDEHKIFVTVTFNSYMPDIPKYAAEVESLSSRNMGERLLNGFTLYNNYEDALIEGINESLKLISYEQW